MYGPAAGDRPTAGSSSRDGAGWALTQPQLSFSPVSAPCPGHGSPGPAASAFPARGDPDRPRPAPGQRTRLNTQGREGGGAHSAPAHSPQPAAPARPSPRSLRRGAPAPGGGTHLPAAARRTRAGTVEQRGGFARTPVLVVVAVAAGPGHLLGDVGHAGRRRRLLRRACPAARSCDRRRRHHVPGRAAGGAPRHHGSCSSGGGSAPGTERNGMEWGGTS